MVSTVGSVEQCFCARSHVSLAVKQQVTNFLAKFGAARLKGANHFAALGTQELFEKVRLSRFPYPVDSFEGTARVFEREQAGAQLQHLGAVGAGAALL